MLTDLWTVGVFPIVILGAAGWFVSYQLYRYMASHSARIAVTVVLTATTIAELLWALAYITLEPFFLASAAYVGTAVAGALAILSTGLTLLMSLNYLRVRSARWKGIRLAASGFAVSLILVAAWLYLYRSFVD